ncbi:aldo/keto reductase [Paenibacillus sp. CF384]|uniref:aldo/keto reductase n=1 Tax=Paenibacillus sp. CF384 TaxID=1884382 RepID=UPI0008973DB3|nr:aldo/keto reductase [Paenibacillus sp. CF384]SDX57970.1 Predicted oxidoreductase [Paenibacillus sp. CF384]
MNKRTIPGTPLEASVICLGTSAYGGTLPKEEAMELLDLFTELGGNFLDTANVYEDWLGKGKSTSERTLGEWLQLRGGRDKIILATKGGHPDLHSMSVSRLSKEEIIHDLEQSLRHLQTDYIDLYWLHRDDPSIPAGEIIETLHEQVAAGKIRAFGCSNWSARRIEEARQYAERRGIASFAASQPLWNLAVLNEGIIADPTVAIMDEKSLAYYKEIGMAVVPFSSQANGFFGGRYFRGQDIQMGGSGHIVKAHYFNDASFDRLDRAKQLAEELGTTASRIALAYLTSQPIPVFPIAGANKRAYMLDSCAAGTLSLTKEQLLFLTGGSPM